MSEVEPPSPATPGPPIFDRVATILRYFREFYIAFAARLEIRHAVSDELKEDARDSQVTQFITQRVTNPAAGLNPNLSWKGL